MTNKNLAAAALICAALFTLLFHRQYIGVNLLLIELLFFIALLYLNRIDLKNKNHILFLSCSFITAIAVVWVNSTLAIIANITAIFILIGSLIYSEARSIFNIAVIAFNNLFSSQTEFIRAWSDAAPKRSVAKTKRSVIFIIPIIIIFFFIWIYRSSNPFFDEYVGNVSSFISTQFTNVFSGFDALLIFTFIMGLIICNFMLFDVANQSVVQKDSAATDFLLRKKRKQFIKFSPTGLQSELIAGCFLLAILNIALLIMNAIDIYWVWFNFSWNGNYLKQFVHEGTYLLLLSIICSIAIVLFFFRANLNFYSKSKILRSLSYFWLLQNAILVISVGVRNYWYISYFALAYKRIALIMFLALTIFGLYTVYKKVKYKKSPFYLFRTNGLALFLVLIFTSLFNWDSIIVNYNFKHADSAFVHLDYLSTFSDKALPEMNKSITQLRQIDAGQKKRFGFEDQYMPTEVYYNKVQKQKESFVKNWPERSWLSWNYAEQKAYSNLQSQ